MRRRRESSLRIEDGYWVRKLGNGVVGAVRPEDGNRCVERGGLSGWAVFRCDDGLIERI